MVMMRLAMEMITPIKDRVERAIATSTGRVVGKTSSVVSFVALVSLSFNTGIASIGLGFWRGKKMMTT